MMDKILIKILIICIVCLISFRYISHNPILTILNKHEFTADQWTPPVLKVPNSV
jgi:hypothetical protein